MFISGPKLNINTVDEQNIDYTNQKQMERKQFKAMVSSFELTVKLQEESILFHAAHNERDFNLYETYTFEELPQQIQTLFETMNDVYQFLMEQKQKSLTIEEDQCLLCLKLKIGSFSKHKRIISFTMRKDILSVEDQLLRIKRNLEEKIQIMEKEIADKNKYIEQLQMEKIKLTRDNQFYKQSYARQQRRSQEMDFHSPENNERHQEKQYRPRIVSVVKLQHHNNYEVYSSSEMIQESQLIGQPLHQRAFSGIYHEDETVKPFIMNIQAMNSNLSHFKYQNNISWNIYTKNVDNQSSFLVGIDQIKNDGIYGITFQAYKIQDRLFIGLCSEMAKRKTFQLENYQDQSIWYCFYGEKMLKDRASEHIRPHQKIIMEVNLQKGEVSWKVSEVEGNRFLNKFKFLLTAKIPFSSSQVYPYVKIIKKKDALMIKRAST